MTAFAKTFASLFNWRQPRQTHTPSRYAIRCRVQVLKTDGTAEVLGVRIPAETPIGNLVSQVSVMLFAEHNLTADVVRIGNITLPASAHIPASCVDLPVNSEGPILVRATR